jgi:hypothetical protein
MDITAIKELSNDAICVNCMLNGRNCTGFPAVIDGEEPSALTSTGLPPDEFS